MHKKSLYQIYLGLDGILKAFEAEGVRHGSISVIANVSDYNSAQFEAAFAGDVEIDQEDNLWKYGALYGNTNIQTSLVIDGMHTLPEGAQQKAREDALFALMKRLPGSKAMRHQGETCLAGRMHAATYYIDIGQALCRKVQTGTRTVTKPANPELVSAFMDTVEKIEVQEPVFKFVCNDAELEAGMI